MSRKCKCGCGEVVSELNPYAYIWRHIPEDAKPVRAIAGERLPRSKYERGELINMLHDWVEKNGRLPTGKDRAGLPSMDTYISFFGTWSNALAVCGYKPRRTQLRSYRSPKRDKVLAYLKSNGEATTAQVSEAVGLPSKVVSNILTGATRQGWTEKIDPDHPFGKARWALVEQPESVAA